MLVAALSAASVIYSASSGLGQPPEPDVPADINKQFDNPDVKSFVDRFESESREVAAQREAITAVLGLEPGMTAADVGAGTGLFTRLLAAKVGPKGKVYAVDISEKFLKHIADEARSRGLSQVETVLGTQTDARLPDGSVDLIFLCDVYHHVEKPAAWLATLHKALKSNGRLVLIEFDREAKTDRSDFLKKHVRAGKSTFLREFRAAGFEPTETVGVPALKENFFQSFRKVPVPGTPGR